MTIEELARFEALSRIVLKLQRENNQLRDTLTMVLASVGYFLKEAAPTLYKQAESALVIRYGDDDPDPDRFDDSYMDRIEDSEENDEEEEP